MNVAQVGRSAPEFSLWCVRVFAKHSVIELAIDDAPDAHKGTDRVRNGRPPGCRFPRVLPT
jgi:hypothetical protein